MFTVAFWLVFIVGGAILLANLSGTLAAGIITIAVLVGFPFWLWSVRND